MFYKDIHKIVVIKSDYKPKIFIVYLNIVGVVYYSASNVPLSFIKIDTIVKETGINRKSVVQYLKALVEEEILYCVHFHINNSITKNYFTRWVHKEHNAEWGLAIVESHYSTDKNKFKGERFEYQTREESLNRGPLFCILD
ncbi:hypothetical protein ACPCKQ_18765 [Bacillus bombysepticus]